MKFLSAIPILALATLFLFTSCGADGDSARDAAVENAASQSPATTPDVTPTTPPPATPEPAQNAAGVWHYTCPAGCAGGGAAAGPCPTCGATLAHNTAYHNTTAAPTATPSTTVVPSGDNGLTPPAPKSAEPAQNAAGVWHYTCPSGCAGGAGTAIACSKCGTTLAHNASYHQ